jgi:co-chaperonin GroES (HSP10)
VEDTVTQVVFTPLLNHVLLRLEPEPEASSIIAVQKSVEGLTRFGTVTAVGPEVRDIKVGQRVLASITASVQIQDTIHMVAEPAILGVCHE